MVVWLNCLPLYPPVCLKHTEAKAEIVCVMVRTFCIIWQFWPTTGNRTYWSHIGVKYSFPVFGPKLCINPNIQDIHPLIVPNFSFSLHFIWSYFKEQRIHVILNIWIKLFIWYLKFTNKTWYKLTVKLTQYSLFRGNLFLECTDVVNRKSWKSLF